MNVIARSVFGFVLCIVAIACSNDELSQAQETTSSPAQIQTVSHPDPARFESGLKQKLEEALNNLNNSPQSGDAEAATGWRELGLLYQGHQFRDLALACYENAAVIDNQDYRHFYLQGLMHQQLGNHPEALEHYHQSLTLKKDDIATLIRIGQVHVRTNQNASAQQYFDRVLALKPNQAAAYAGLGEAALQDSRYQDAADNLQKALQIEPSADRLHYPLALAYRNLGNTELARSHLARKGSTYAYVPDPLSESAGKTLGTSQHHVKRGLTAFEQNDFATAAVEYRLAVEARPEVAENQLALAWVLEQLGEFGDAEVHATRALELDPSLPKAHYVMGRLAERQEKDRDAVKYFSTATQLDTESLPPRVFLAASLMRVRDFSKAHELYLNLAAQTGNPQYLYYQALTAMAAGQCNEAFKPLADIRAKNPRNAEAAAAQVRLFATCPQANNDQKSLGYELGRMLYQGIPDFDHAEAAALAAAALNKFDEARQWQEQALKLAKEQNVDTTAMAKTLQLINQKKTIPAAWDYESVNLAPERLGKD